ncbi:MAG: hypothetical protein RLZZ373_3199 [Pseudomonadota bacterium]|jgi:hypothetical protein
MIDRKLQPNFHLSEFLVSQRATRQGINNTPTADHLKNIADVLSPGVQRVRDLLGSAMLISSGYRSAALNAATPGASTTSAHLLGLAIDFTCPGYGSPRAVAKLLLANREVIAFDQVILEDVRPGENSPGAWVHLAFAARGRMDIRSGVRCAGGRWQYPAGLV